MKNALQTRILAVALAALTLAACVLAGLNLASEASYNVPDRWHRVDRSPRRPLRPADPRGLRRRRARRTPRRHSRSCRRPRHTAPRLLRPPDLPRRRLEPRHLHHPPAPHRPASSPRRAAISPSGHSRAHRPLHQLRPAPHRPRLPSYRPLYSLSPLDRPKSTHFYLFCLASFILYAFRYTGQFDLTDNIVYWATIVAGALQPALFLHFAFSFAESSHPGRLRRLLASLLYLPGALFVAIRSTAILRWSATETLKHRLDKIALAYMAICYLWAAGIFFFRARRSQFPLERQQLNGLPAEPSSPSFPYLLYVLPFLLDLAVPTPFANLVRLSLVFLPLTFSWAIVRYRLMDVDLIFKRGVTYTIATAALVGLYFAVIAVFAINLHQRLPEKIQLLGPAFDHPCHRFRLRPAQAHHPGLG